MLKRLRVDNFKSLINLVFEPGQVNLLIGRNNSGKTNLCQAMRFLCASVTRPLSDAAILANVEPWNLTNAYLNKDVVTFECDSELQADGDSLVYEYELTLKAAPAPHLGPIGRELYVESERLTIFGGRFSKGAVLLENEQGQVVLLHEGRHDAQGLENSYVETTAPTNATMLSRLYDLQHNRFANLFRMYISGWLYHDLDSLRLRSTEARTQGLILNPDGSNLAHVLFQLKNLDEKQYRRLVEIVREVEPKLDAINFVPPTQESIFMTFTDMHNRRFTVEGMSNGTLRYMALAYVMMIIPAIAEVGPVVMIEEPENGLYVGCLKKLMELLEPASESDPQFIFTSHSPYFIDLFDRYLDDVFLMKSDGTHSEIVRPGSDRLNRIVDKFSLGEAYYRELLG